jgi:hypothetical protein
MFADECIGTYECPQHTLHHYRLRTSSLSDTDRLTVARRLGLAGGTAPTSTANSGSAQSGAKKMSTVLYILEQMSKRFQSLNSWPAMRYRLLHEPSLDWFLKTTMKRSCSFESYLTHHPGRCHSCSSQKVRGTSEGPAAPGLTRSSCESIY